MDFREALKKFESSPHSKAVKEKGYLLNSGIALLRSCDCVPEQEWIFTFYNIRENKVIQADIGDDVTVTEPSEPLNPSKTLLDTEKVKLSEKDALEKSVALFSAYKKPLSQVILTIQQADVPFWRASFITKSLEVVIVELNAESGEVLKNAIESLVKIEGKPLPLKGGF